MALKCTAPLIIKMNKTNTETKDFPTRKTQMKEENSLWKLSDYTNLKTNSEREI